MLSPSVCEKFKVDGLMKGHHVDLTVTVISLFFLDSKLLMVSGFL